MKTEWTIGEIRDKFRARYCDLCAQQLIAQDRGDSFESLMIWVHYRQSLLSTAVCCFNLGASDIEEPAHYILERLTGPTP